MQFLQVAVKFYYKVAAKYKAEMHAMHVEVSWNC